MLGALHALVRLYEKLLFCRPEARRWPAITDTGDGLVGEKYRGPKRAKKVNGGIAVTRPRIARFC